MFFRIGSTVGQKKTLIPSGKHTKNYGRSTMLSMGNSTISIGPFSSSQTVTNYQRVNIHFPMVFLWFSHEKTSIFLWVNPMIIPCFSTIKSRRKCHGFAWLIQATRPLPLVKTPRAWRGVKFVQVEKTMENL